MIQQARLGGVRGFADLHGRYRSPLNPEWRGTFVYRAEDERMMYRLAQHLDHVVYEAEFDGEAKSIVVQVTGIAPAAGVAFFEGSGAPVWTSERMAES